MMTWVTSLFISEDDNDPAFVHLIRNMLIVTFAVLLLLSITQSGLLVGSLKPSELNVSLALTALTSFLVFLATRKILWPSKLFLPLFLLASITYFISRANGLHDVAALAFPVVVFIASLLMGRRSLLGWSIITSACIGLVGYLDMAGFTPEPVARTTGFDTIAVGILMIMASAGTINSLLSRFEEIIARSRRSEQEQILANKELKELQVSLENRVAERTSDAEMASLLSERRARELQSISEITRIISTEQKQEVLFSLIARLVSEHFDFYHVGVFLVDDTDTFAVLQASNSEGGKSMLKRGHKLEVGQSSIVGEAARSGKARIALDVGSDATYFNNPDLPNTRSEMALPLIVHSQIIGVLDVQSVKVGAFTEDDSNTLGILADQIATAIQNAHLFGQIQQARDDAEALYNKYIKTDWATFVNQETQIGYHQSIVGGKPLEIPVENEEIHSAIDRGEVVIVNGKNDNSQPSIAVPVKLRGQTIGVLNIKAPTNNRIWADDEIKLTQAISDRLALALDNARLLQESQRNAAKEAKIGEVTTKISSSINLQSVLQTAVEELGHALPGSDIVIQFKVDDK